MVSKPNYVGFLSSSLRSFIFLPLFLCFSSLVLCLWLIHFHCSLSLSHRVWSGDSEEQWELVLEKQITRNPHIKFQSVIFMNKVQLKLRKFKITS